MIDWLRKNESEYELITTRCVFQLNVFQISFVVDSIGEFSSVIGVIVLDVLEIESVDN